MKKSLSAVVFAGVAAALVLAGAPAANAAPPIALPPGQTLYAIDCDDAAPQLWSLAPNGAGTPIGGAGTGFDCAGGGQVNPVTGIAYLIYYGTTTTALATVNLTTGSITMIADITGDSTDAWQLFITNSGDAFMVVGTTLYSISLTTAVTTTIGLILPADGGAVGYNPLNDTIYAFDSSNNVGVYTIDRTTGAATDTGLTGIWPTANCLNGGTDVGTPNGVSFDSAGFAWVQSDSCDSNIMTVDLTTGTAAMVGELFDATGTRYATAPNGFYSSTFIIGPSAVVAPAAAPGLAATGIDATAASIAAGIGAVAALIGAALVLRSRRTA